jgi:AcrR family transcriptional regulator
MPVTPASTDSTRDRILAATVEAAAIHGITRLSVADVAKRAGISRPTLYKHFPSKDALIGAAVLREAGALTAAVVAAADRHDAPEQALEAAVLTVLQLTREHPLLDRVVRTEPEALLPFLVSDGGPVMLLARRTIEQVMADRFPHLDAVPARRLADILTRLLVSYAVSAPDDPPEVVAATLALFAQGALVASGAVEVEDR